MILLSHGEDELLPLSEGTGPLLQLLVFVITHSAARTAIPVLHLMEVRYGFHWDWI